MPRNLSAFNNPSSVLPAHSDFQNSPAYNPVGPVKLSRFRFHFAPDWIERTSPIAKYDAILNQRSQNFINGRTSPRGLWYCFNLWAIPFGIVSMDTNQGTSTLSKEQWLERALEAVSKEGGSRLRVNKLVKEVGVTKGSFYWHFEGRKDFVLRLIDYWHEAYTRTVADYLDNHDGSASEKLFDLLNMVFVQKLTRHDLAIRAWAIDEPAIRSRIKRTDDFRVAYVCMLLEQMGFDEVSADFRARLFLGEASWEGWRYDDLTEAQRKQKAKDFYDLMVGEWSHPGQLNESTVPAETIRD